jgi:hypothetical protein
VKEIRHRKTNTTCSHPYVEAKKADLIEVESRLVVTRDCKLDRNGNMERDWLTTARLKLDRENNF